MTKMPREALRITNEAQIDVEVGVPNQLEEGQDKFSSSQDNLPPPKVNQSNAGVVRRTKKKGNPLTVKEKKVPNKRKHNSTLFQSKENSIDIEKEV